MQTACHQEADERKEESAPELRRWLSKMTNDEQSHGM
jgi:hypothetical protein